MQLMRLRIVFTVMALAGAATSAAALGFGPAPDSAALGQPLDYRVGLRLETGEQVDPHCVSAEVIVGEHRLPAAVVAARIEGEGASARVRVLTSVGIDEPIVTVAVAVGCPPRLSRRFVLLADPLPAATASMPFSVPPSPAASATELASPAAVSGATPARRTAAARPDSRAAAQPAPARAPRPARTRTAERRTAPAAETAPAVAARRPRLRLEAAEGPTGPVAAEAVEAAASAAAAAAAAESLASAEAASAASAAAARVAALEQSIAKLQADAAADREAILHLRERAAQGDSAARWMPWLLALMLGLGLLAVWQALKLRRLQADRQHLWSRAVAEGTGHAAAARSGGPVSSVEPTTAAMAPPSTGGYSSTRPPTLSPVFAPDSIAPSAVESTEVLPMGWREQQGGETPRDVSIEELIDLEQQAEFFIVLGQDEAAIDLLVDYLRSTGGGSPMPYLKLLEIYRRRADREAYERTRARFNHRFNAYAPDWDTGENDGRSLEDYPSIVARLEQAWTSPIDAMAELESLLFRKSRGELFDMPAYRDVLFLYAMARDLMDRESVDTSNVDVLLPISESVDRTQPMSLDQVPGAPDSGPAPLDNMPTVPVDLDITQPAMPDSLFGDSTLPLGEVRRRI